ncbi:MAG TPA: arabinogalactan endo-1,4-beta-galactosidase [Chitinophagaceae bacterium]|nr:arabinogalactan endo-1,4-beta-galactosidase [Chitinophagaceae bacterium]HAN39939.1 arabinogalactan endo-1,4-beta-galactosidase [Chitinophagaceae bacterium]
MIRFYIICMLCFWGFSACSKNNSTANNDTANPKYSWQQFAFGVDLSYVNALEQYGVKYQANGITTDAYTALANAGANVVRVRLWHNPQWHASLHNGKIYNDLADVTNTIRRAKQLGMAVNLDIHYSDTWADPAHQTTPAAWQQANLATLQDSVYNYTLRVLQHLAAQNLTPEMVQVGNETNSGMLWPYGKVENGQFANFASLLNAGIRAVRNFSQNSGIKPKIILHVAQFQNGQYWLNGIMRAGVTDFDIVGVSHYQQWSTLSSMEDVALFVTNLKQLSGNKQVMVVETAYAWTNGFADNYPNIITTQPWNGYGVSKTEQQRYLTTLTQQVIRGGGSGVMYWEPAWITSGMRDLWNTGSPWENATLFDFDGKLLPSAAFMTERYRF